MPMNTDESLRLYGLPPSDDALPAIRQLLQAEAELEKAERGEERTQDLALLCCVQLFSKARNEDIMRIWRAKTSGFDMHCSIDVQLLCGSGLEETKAYLWQSAEPDAAEALAYIEECQRAGDFDDFTPESDLAFHCNTFGVTP